MAVPKAITVRSPARYVIPSLPVCSAKRMEKKNKTVAPSAIRDSFKSFLAGSFIARLYQRVILNSIRVESWRMLERYLRGGMMRQYIFLHSPPPCLFLRISAELPFKYRLKVSRLIKIKSSLL